MLRSWLLTIHVVTAMVYVGGHIVETLLFFKPEALAGKANLFRTIRAGESAINVAAPLMIITGVWMVIADPAWGFDTPFVVIGIGGIIVGAVIGLVYALPGLSKLEDLVREKEDHDEEVLTRYRSVRSTWVGLGGLYLFITWAMVIKP